MSFYPLFPNTNKFLCSLSWYWQVFIFLLLDTEFLSFPNIEFLSFPNMEFLSIFPNIN